MQKVWKISDSRTAAGFDGDASSSHFFSLLPFSPASYWRCRFSKRFKPTSFSARSAQVAFGYLPCAAGKEREVREAEGINLAGRAAKQVQPKVSREAEMLIIECFFEVDEGKVRACSMYQWKRSEKKEKASIYYRWRLHKLDLCFCLISLPEKMNSFFFRGGDVYKGEVNGLQGGPNAISR